MFEGTAWERWIADLIERMFAAWNCRRGIHSRETDHRWIYDLAISADEPIGDVVVYTCRRPGCKWREEWRSEQGSKPFRVA